MLHGKRIVNVPTITTFYTQVATAEKQIDMQLQRS